MKKGFRLSDHIMPRRMVQRFLWLIPESMVAYIIFKASAFIWRPAYLLIRGGRYPVFVITALVISAIPSFWQALRLGQDQTMRVDFLNSTSDGSYKAKSDLRMIFRCDELWNDTAAAVISYIFVFTYAIYRTWVNTMLDLELTNAQAWGLFDMHGNVREFCEDTFNPHISHHPAIDPCYKNESSNLHTTRGGSWLYAPIGCRCSTRECGSKENEIGFRIIMEQE